MRKLFFTLAGIAFTVVTVVLLLLSAKSTTFVIDDNSSTPPARLTEAEERDLRQLIPQTLSWIAIWRQPTPCLVNNDIQELNFATTYKKMAKQEIPMDLEIKQRSVEVSFDSLHVSLKFERLYNLGLAPADVTVFCEKTYREYKAAIARVFKENQKRSDEPRKDNQKAADQVLDRLRQMHPPPSEDVLIGTESRRYTVPENEVAADATAKSPEKKVLYERILEEIRKQLAAGCTHGEKNHVTIPDFNIGDPAVYVLINGSLFGGGNYIDWIDFRRDPSSGEYMAQHVKSFGLPDEIEPFVKLIQQKPGERTTLSCSDK